MSFDKFEKASRINELVKLNHARKMALRSAARQQQRASASTQREAYLRDMTEMTDEELEAEKAAQQFETRKPIQKVDSTKKSDKKQNITDLDSLLDDL